MSRLSCRLAVLCLAFALPAHAQDGLAYLIPSIYGPDGLIVDSLAVLPDGSTHSAHFNGDFQTEFTQFNSALGAQLAALPLPSLSSGFTYTFDETTGTFARSAQSFGPIYAERADTIGKGKLAFGFNAQHFSFDTIEGVSLEGIHAVFTHDDAAPGGRADVVTTVNRIDVSLTQATTFLSYGLTDRIDLSLAVPIISTDLAVTSDATIRRLGTEEFPDVHFFGEVGGTERSFERSGSATGVGDLLVRVKGASKRGRTGLALGLDLRLPTGDEEDLLGSGAFGVRPFLALTFSRGKLSPHLNLAYQWNGDSVLAGDVSTGVKADLPDQIVFAGGLDVGISPRVTLAFDLLAQHVQGTSSLNETTFAGLDPGATTFQDIEFRENDLTELSAAVGMKTNIRGGLLLDLNLLIALNDDGLRDGVTPLVGIEYAF